MEATAENKETARAIINVLAENCHTVCEAEEILRFTTYALRHHTFVQKIDKLFEVESNPS